VYVLPTLPILLRYVVLVLVLALLVLFVLFSQLLLLLS
jgi:hypothetical protein